MKLGANVASRSLTLKPWGLWRIGTILALLFPWKAAATCHALKFLTTTAAKFDVFSIVSDSRVDFLDECQSPKRGKAPISFYYEAVITPHNAAIFKPATDVVTKKPVQNINSRNPSNSPREQQTEVVRELHKAEWISFCW